MTTRHGFAALLSVLDSRRLTGGFDVTTPTHRRRRKDVIAVPPLSDDDVRASQAGFEATQPCLR